MSKTTAAKKSSPSQDIAGTRVSEPYQIQADEPSLLKGSLAYVVKRTAVRCDGVLVRHLDGEISPARLSALSCVGVNPGMSQASLGALLGIAGPSVVKVVDDLEALGLLQRTPSPDRRVSALHLTRAGGIKLKRYSEAVDQCEAEIAEALTHDEREMLIGLLSKVAAADTVIT